MNVYNYINWDTNSLATILYIEIDIHIYAVVLKNSKSVMPRSKF